MDSAPFVIVVDANVLFPLTLRDTVLRAAAAGYFRLCWSREILDEMERNLVASLTMGAGNALKLRAAMEQYFPEAMVTGYEPLIEAQSADDFLCNLFDLDPDGFVALLQSQSADLQNPPVSLEMLIERLDRAVPEFAQAVRQHRSP